MKRCSRTLLAISLSLVFWGLAFCLPLTAQTVPAQLSNSNEAPEQQIEDFSIWPVDLKINGVVVASSNPPPETILSSFKKLGSTKDGEEKRGLLVINFAASDAESLTMFESVEHVEFEHVTESAIKSKLKGFQGVVLLSEQPITKEQVQLLGDFSTELAEFIRSGKLCIGVGPVVSRLGRFKYDVMMGMSFLSEELNLIPDAIVMADYVDGMDRKTLLSALANEPRCVGIGLPPETAITLDGRKIGVSGDGKATFALMANEREPLRVQHVGKVTPKNRSPYQISVDLTAWRRDAIERTLPAFPAKEPPTPMVENGTLVIVGGGGMPAKLMDRFVQLAGGSEANLIYVPCTERDAVSATNRQTEQWKKMGVKSVHVFHTKDRIKASTDSEFLKPLETATGIWFGGGRQWNFSDSYYGTKAHQMMKSVLQRGGVIGGSSAGASIQADYLARANPIANFDIMAPGYERGLGFLQGVAIDQHFSQRARQPDMTQLVDRYPQLLGIGIDEGTALIVEKSVGSVVGKGRVYFYDRNLPVIPGKRDFVFLKNGGRFDLANRLVLAKQDEPSNEKVEQDSTPSPISEKTRRLIDSAAKRLVELQEEDGAWPYEGVYRVNRKIPVGYRVGGTAIVCSALLAAPGEKSAATVEAISKGLKLIVKELDDPRMVASDADTYDVRVWGHIYALDLFCQVVELEQTEEQLKRWASLTRPLIKGLVSALLKEEIKSGGWNYAGQRRHACFVTAPAIQALKRAKELGFEIPDDVFSRTVQVLQESRSENGSFQYSGTLKGRRAADLLPGAIARAPVCEATLISLGQGNVENLRASIEAFYQHWDELEKRRKKTGTHVAPYGVAPYYFYYGHRYLAQAIKSLPADEHEAAYKRFEAILIKTKDPDSTWNDRVFDRSKAYGTAMSVLGLSRK